MRKISFPVFLAFLTWAGFLALAPRSARAQDLDISSVATGHFGNIWEYANCLRYVFIPDGCEVANLIIHWRPELIIETVKKVGDSVLAGTNLQQSMTNAETSASSQSGATPTSGNDDHNRGGHDLQFNEVRIYRNPALKKMDSSPYFCPDPNSWNYKKPLYVSEADSEEWRLAGGERSNMFVKTFISYMLGELQGCSIGEGVESLDTLLDLGIGDIFGGYCMGFWGGIYPRWGWLKHSSEPVGSISDAFRGAHIITHPEMKGQHVVFSKIETWQATAMGLSTFQYAGDYEDAGKLTIDTIQPIYPKLGGCINIGEIPVKWEQEKSGKNLPGKYVWIYWRPIVCCR